MTGHVVLTEDYQWIFYGRSNPRNQADYAKSTFLRVINL